MLHLRQISPQPALLTSLLWTIETRLLRGEHVLWPSKGFRWPRPALTLVTRPEEQQATFSCPTKDDAYDCAQAEQITPKSQLQEAYASLLSQWINTSCTWSKNRLIFLALELESTTA